jgi:hypothetical protein
VKTVIATTRVRAPDAEDPPARETSVAARSRLWWWLPVALAGVYAVVLVPELPALVRHSWWSADSGSAGVIAQLYIHPPAGQYIVLGNHGWYEALSFYLLTKGLPAHRVLWYCLPIAVWVCTIALVGMSAGRAFGRYGAGLAIAGLLCLAPGGLLLIFQPTAHTNVVFHAAALAVVTGWVLPRIRTLPLPIVLGAGVLIGAFTGLAIAGDAIALAWAVLPFVVVVGVCARRGPMVAAARTLAFALVTLTSMLVVLSLFTAVMHSAGIRVDELAQSVEMQFVKPGALVANIGKMLNELAYLVGGNFLGHRMNRTGFIELVSGGTLLLGASAVVFAVYRLSAGRGGGEVVGGGGFVGGGSVVGEVVGGGGFVGGGEVVGGSGVVGEVVDGGEVVGAPAPGSGAGGRAGAGVTPKLVHVVFWTSCLTFGLLMFLLSSVGTVDYRYLVGPLVAIAALLPVAAARSTDWRIAVGVGLAVMACTGLVRLDTRPVPYLPLDVPLTNRDMAAVTRFAHRYDVSYGYAVYWDAVTITWHTKFAVDLHPVFRCGQLRERFCPAYHADSFTAAYIPRRGLRTLFIADSRFHSTPPVAWGRPIAREHIGRLTLYAYPYDIASRLSKPPPGEVRRVITGSAL